MTNTFRLALAQLNPTVGDIAGNYEKAKTSYHEASQKSPDYIVFPEMFITGYQTQDLILKPAFIRDAMAHIQNLAKITLNGPALGIGGPYLDGDGLFNAYYILENGRVKLVIKKHHRPNEDVFDEVRLFAQGPIQGPYEIAGVRIGSPICEDAWHEDVCEALEESGAEILIIPNGSPYRRGKMDVRQNVMVSRSIETRLPLVYLNMVGGQDDQVFDGGSFALNPGGKLAAQLPQFDELLDYIDFTKTGDQWLVQKTQLASLPDTYEADYRCMVESLRDYCRKTRFKTVLLGMSGGIDSALVATIAADALGPENVHCVMLPSEYTSEHSLEDAKQCAEALGCHYDTLPISAAREAVTTTLAPFFAGKTPDVTEENIQSRLRQVFLMALSNKFGGMLLTTGNKSEVAVGYATIYGDMAGGYNPIKDLYKTRVFKTCEWRNENHRSWMKAPEGEVVPARIISKPPSAELRPDQKDSDSLPPYDVLDAILERLIDRDMAVCEIVEDGFDYDTVKRVEHLIYISEYKRFQSAPGCRLSLKAFWLDRRYPIVNAWRDTTS